QAMQGAERQLRTAIRDVQPRLSPDGLSRPALASAPRSRHGTNTSQKTELNRTPATSISSGSHGQYSARSALSWSSDKSPAAIAIAGMNPVNAIILRFSGGSFKLPP